MNRRHGLLLVAVLLSNLGVFATHSQSRSSPGVGSDAISAPEPGFSVETIVFGLVEPLCFAYAPDGRIFIGEKAGRVRVVEDGLLLPTPFIDVSDDVNAQHDRGLIGIAIDPDFSNNGRLFLNYTQELQPGNPDQNVTAGGKVMRVDASTVNPNVANLATIVTILDGHNNISNTHSVGDIDFDNDGNLIFSWGDGGFSDTNRRAAQDPDEKEGKFYRVDPVTGNGIAANAYYDSLSPGSTRSKVWTLGVRNAWRFTVDRLTGDVYFGDVTDNGPEEVHVIAATITDPSVELNFGWPCYEGTENSNHFTNLIDLCDGLESDPVFLEMQHVGSYDAITGGAVFRGNNYPAFWDGRYFFANFGQDILYTADATGAFTEFGDGGWDFPVDIQLGPDGRIQFLSITTGELRVLVHDSVPTNRPIALAEANPTSGIVPLMVQFTGSNSSVPNGGAIYLWTFGDGDSSSAADPAHVYTQPGTYPVQLVVRDAINLVSVDGLTVTVGSLENGIPLSLGNPIEDGTDLDGWRENMAVNETDLYVNNTGEAEQIRIDSWEFYARRNADPLTPFVVRVLGDNDFVVLAVGDSRTNSDYDPGPNSFPFADAVAPVVTLQPGEVLATGFLDALADGSGDAGGSVIPGDFNTGDELWYTGGPDPGNSGSVQVGQPPQPGANTLTNLTREYKYQLHFSRLPQNRAPNAVASIDLSSGPAPHAVEFSSAGSMDPDGDPLTYAWDFGDGHVSSLENPPHIYTTEGGYTAQLIVSDGDGLADSMEVLVSVSSTLPIMNLALGQPAAHSTSAPGGAAANANDGGYSGDFADGSVSATLLQRQPFWEVDLGSSFYLKNVALFNRTDCCSDDLNDYWILVSENAFQSGNLDAVRSEPGVWSVNRPDTVGARSDVALGLMGRYLRVQLAAANTTLYLAEVVVTGTEPPSIATVADQLHAEGDHVHIELTRTDADDSTATYVAEGLPTGVSVQTVTDSTAALAGFVANGTAAVYDVDVIVNDVCGAADTTRFTWTVVPDSLGSDLVLCSPLDVIAEFNRDDSDTAGRGASGYTIDASGFDSTGVHVSQNPADDSTSSFWYVYPDQQGGLATPPISIYYDLGQVQTVESVYLWQQEDPSIGMVTQLHVDVLPAVSLSFDLPTMQAASWQTGIQNATLVTAVASGQRIAFPNRFTTRYLRLTVLNHSDGLFASAYGLNEIAVAKSTPLTATPDGLPVAAIPARAALLAYPNPFNPITTLRLDLPADQPLTWRIYDVAGRRVKELHRGPLHAGVHLRAWAGVDDQGSPVAGGIYFQHVETPTFRRTTKLVVLK